jgi:hypothetical protein
MMASLEKQLSTDGKGDAAHVEDAAHIQSGSSSEKRELGALEAQTPNAQNKASQKSSTIKAQ